MKKLRLLITFVLTTLLVIPSLSIQTKAKNNSYDYYYENYDISVEIGDDRCYKVKESLDVYYNKEMHGIIRSIPKLAEAESYLINDLKVKGAESKITEYSSTVDVRIGSADKTVTGLQHYEITYTLEHFIDYDSQNDHILFNLLGSDFDVPVEHFTATVTLNDGLEATKHELYSGVNTTENKFATYEKQDNIYLYKADNVEPYNAITVHMYLEEGAFINAKEYPFDFIINEEKISIEFNEEKNASILVRYTITNKDDFAKTLSTSAKFLDDGHTSLQDFKALKGDCVLDGSRLKFNVGANTTQSFEARYTLHYNNIFADSSFSAIFIPRSANTKVEQFDYTITIPVNHNYNIYCGRDKLDTSKYTSTRENRNTLHITSNYPVYSGETFRVDYDYDNSGFYRQYPIQAAYTTIAGLIATLLFIFKVKFTNKKGYRPTAPASLNSLEISYLYNGERFTDAAIGSIILYWASKGYLTITQKAEDDWSVHKLKEADKTMETCERAFYRRLFSNNNKKDKTTFSYKSLRSSFGPGFSVYSAGIEKKYNQGKYTLHSAHPGWLNILWSIIGGLTFAIIQAYPLYFTTGSVEGIFINGILGGIVLAFCIILIYNNYYRTTSWWPKIIFGGFLMLFIGFEAIVANDKTSLLFLAIATIVGFLVGHYGYRMTNRSKLGKQLELEVNQFRNFLIDYKPDENDAEMFEYDMLPYAIALGLEKSWTQKFERVRTVAPKWYIIGSGQDMYNDRYWCYYCNKFHRDMGHTAHRYESSYTSSGSSSSYSGGSSYSGSSSSSSYSGSSSSSYSSSSHSGGGSGGGGSKGW